MKLPPCINSLQGRKCPKSTQELLKSEAHCIHLQTLITHKNKTKQKPKQGWGWGASEAPIMEEIQIWLHLRAHQSTGELSLGRMIAKWVHNWFGKQFPKSDFDLQIQLQLVKACSQNCSKNTQRRTNGFKYWESSGIYTKTTGPQDVLRKGFAGEPLIMKFNISDAQSQRLFQ